jgi:hypothetical protein
MAKKRVRRRSIRPRRTLAIEEHRLITTEEREEAELDARVVRTLDDMEQRIEIICGANPRIAEEQAFRLWVVNRLAVFESMLQEMSGRIEASRTDD